MSIPLLFKTLCHKKKKISLSSVSKDLLNRTAQEKADQNTRPENKLETPALVASVRSRDKLEDIKFCESEQHIISHLRGLPTELPGRNRLVIQTHV